MNYIMVDLTIVQENIKQALCNLANIETLVKEAQKALVSMSEERRKDMLYLSQVGKDGKERTIIETFEEISSDLAGQSRWVFDELNVIFKSFYKHHLNNDERIEFSFAETSHELLDDVLDSNKS